jgi:SAM-dependent methyltransferase
VPERPAVIRIARRTAGKIIRTIPWLRRQVFASTDYAILSREDSQRQQASGWLQRLTAHRQQRAYEGLLQQMHAGQPRIDLTAAAEAIRATGLAKPSVLEVGCGGGYYSEVLAHFFGENFDYFGIDYAAEMVTVARGRYPGRRFDVGNACALDLPERSVDVVFNGVSLMHILDYERAIAEGSRVARTHCIYHSLPLFDDRPTTYLRKYAYGAPVIEVVFNRRELLACFERNGLTFVRSWQSIPYDVHPVTPEHSRCETFLLSVQSPPTTDRDGSRK